MEFLRFGSSIPGEYWGCCCADIIQNFKQMPDTKASIQLVSGDSGTDLGRFLGPTLEDIFWSRLRIGTFSTRDMPNHAFFAIITDWQLKTKEGLAWLAILKKAGFEFLRSVSNSVGAGASLLEGEPTKGRAINYIFALFRNIGNGAVPDPFTPPKEWTDLPTVAPEAWNLIGTGAAAIADYDLSTFDTVQFAKEQRESHTQIWNRTGPAKMLTEEEIISAGAPVVMAGQRLPHAQPETKEEREKFAGKKTSHRFSFSDPAMVATELHPQKG